MKDAALREAVHAKTEVMQAKQKVEEFAERLTAANLLVSSGQSHADAGRWREATRDDDAAVDMQPGYFLPRVQRAQLYTRLNLWEEASKDYGIAIQSGASASQSQW